MTGRKILLIGVAAFSMLLGSGIGQAAGSVTLNDAYGKTIEPILTRSSLAVQETTAHGAANITGMTFAATGTKLEATITTATALPRNASHLFPTCSATNTCRVDEPYGGVHLMAMFQTDLFEVDQPIGADAAGQTVTWGPPGYNADGFRWFLYYGLVSQRAIAGDTPDCGLGYYDPTGQIVSPVPVGFGQTFFVLGQNGPATCTFSNSDKTVKISINYTWNWQTRAGLPRSVKVAEVGKPIKNILGFSWLDHEIGGPDPVGLILGWTWYTDSIPRSAYKVGVIAGDPNPAVFAGPKCLTNFVGGVPAPGFETPGPCAIPNPIGTGFTNTGTNITA